jgi:hypothetical protein
MIYVIMDSDYSSASLVAVLKGPFDLDLETLFKAWYTKEVLDVIGRAPRFEPGLDTTGEAYKQLEQEGRAYYNTQQAHYTALQKKYGAKEKEWNHIFVEVLIKEYGFERVHVEEHDFYPRSDW